MKREVLLSHDRLSRQWNLRGEYQIPCTWSRNTGTRFRNCLTASSSATQEASGLFWIQLHLDRNSLDLGTWGWEKLIDRLVGDTRYRDRAEAERPGLAEASV